jgi:outer membrane protein assembly factor BamE (lipoprotein component of BamABCDE complex)
VKGGNIAENPDNTNTYTIQFHAPYGSQLKSISIAGKAIDGFSPLTYEYTVANTYKASQFECKADEEAKVEKSFNSETFELTVTVKGGDFAENPTNVHTYVIQYHAPYESYLTDLSINGETISEFSSTKYNYSVQYVYAEGLVSYKKSVDAVVEENYNAENQTYTIIVKGGDFAENSTNIHTYTINFHDSYGSQLKSLTINLTNVADFAADKYEYIIEDYYENGKVKYTLDDTEASATEKFDATTNQLEIVVKGGDYEFNNSNTHTYTLQFWAKSLLTNISYNGNTVPAFRQDKYEYRLTEYAYDEEKITYTVAEGATANAKYDAENNTLEIEVIGSDIDRFPKNKHTYKVVFRQPSGSYLTSISINEKELENFNKTTFNYLIKESYKNGMITFTQDKDASVSTNFKEETNQYVIVVKGDDYDSNPTNTHTYTLQFYAPSTLSSIRVNNVNIAGFEEDKYEYVLNNIVYKNANVVTKGADNATVEQSFDEKTNVLTVTVKGSDIATYPDNFKTYKIQFAKPLESQLTDLKINGTTIEGFDRNTFDYVSKEFYQEGMVTYAADSAAIVSTTFDKENFRLTLEVKGGDYEKNKSNIHTYTISFEDPTYYGSQLTTITFDGVEMDGFSKDVYEYVIDGSYSDVKVDYVGDELSTVSAKFDVEKNALKIIVEGGNIKKDPSNVNTYTINFTSTFNFEALVTSLKINGVEAESFNPNRFNCTIAEDYSTSDVTIEVSKEANYCADYNQTTRELTIVVWAGDFEKNNKNFTTYKVTFKK